MGAAAVQMEDCGAAAANGATDGAAASAAHPPPSVGDVVLTLPAAASAAAARQPQRHVVRVKESGLCGGHQVDGELELKLQSLFGGAVFIVLPPTLFDVRLVVNAGARRWGGGKQIGCWCWRWVGSKLGAGVGDGCVTVWKDWNNGEGGIVKDKDRGGFEGNRGRRGKWPTAAADASLGVRKRRAECCR